MRKLSTLYKMVHKEFVRQKTFGICYAMLSLYDSGYITCDEYHTVKTHMHTQKPTPELNSKFYVRMHDTSGYWWHLYHRESDVKRLAFVEHLRKECRKQKI